MTCTVCRHQRKTEIDEAILDGATLREIAQKFDVSPDAVHRHKSHVPAAIVKADEARQALEGSNLLAQLFAITVDTRELFVEAKKAKDRDGALKAVARLEKQLELQAKLLGELQQEGTVNVFVSPGWPTFRLAVLEAVQGHPDARAALSTVLRRLNAAE